MRGEYETPEPGPLLHVSERGTLFIRNRRSHMRKTIHAILVCAALAPMAAQAPAVFARGDC